MIHQNEFSALLDYIYRDIAAVRPFADDIWSWTSSVLIATIAIGFFTMAIIQIFKFKLRSSFHKEKVSNWLAMKSISHTDIFSDLKFRVIKTFRNWFAQKSTSNSDILTDLIELSIAGNENALFILPTEQLCGQIIAATEIVLADPKKHKELLQSLAAFQKKDRISNDDKPSALEDDIACLTNFKGSQEEAHNIAYIDARNRISHRIQRNVDALQISTSYSWRRKLQRYAIRISGVLAFVGSMLFSRCNQALTIIAFSVMTAFVGGYVASFLRDIAAAIEKLRK
jgi:hypothetical protein